MREVVFRRWPRHCCCVPVNRASEKVQRAKMNRRALTIGTIVPVLFFAVLRESVANDSDEVTVQQIDAWIYWYNLELGRLLEVSSTGDQITGKIQKRHGQFPFVISKSAINNPSAKESALKEVVGELITWLRGGTDFEEFAIQRLAEITGERFSTSNEWVEWYKMSSGRLKLSGELGRLVVN